jgi:class 3 adenylate cyclase
MSGMAAISTNGRTNLLRVLRRHRGPQTHEFESAITTIDGKGDPSAVDGGFKTRPIVDFLPKATIMFADISGFTAWASTREPVSETPVKVSTLSISTASFLTYFNLLLSFLAHVWSQVFLLIETVYGSFDALAKRRGVFKVETIGDCYVAVCGVPKAQKHHAVIMARFAQAILSKMNVLTQELEVALGPDTADLAFRIGLHRFAQWANNGGSASWRQRALSAVR